MGEPKNSITASVRQYAAANSLIRKKQVGAAFGYSADQVASAVRTLVDQGFLKRISHGVYEYMDRSDTWTDAPLNDKLWRAMRIMPSFTAAEIARRSGATVNYVNKAFRQYRAGGHIRQMGRKKNLAGAYEKIWRLSPSSKECFTRPTLDIFKPDPLVVKVADLNKLVCTGVAGRAADKRDLAVKLCTELMAALMDPEFLQVEVEGKRLKGED